MDEYDHEEVLKPSRPTLGSSKKPSVDYVTSHLKREKAVSSNRIFIRTMFSNPQEDLPRIHVICPRPIARILDKGENFEQAKDKTYKEKLAVQFGR